MQSIVFVSTFSEERTFFVLRTFSEEVFEGEVSVDDDGGDIKERVRGLVWVLSGYEG